MPNELVALRLAQDLLERIDQHAADLSDYTGTEVTRADVIRKCIVEGLKQWVPEKKRKK